jgi:hypothetical protein
VPLRSFLLLPFLCVGVGSSNAKGANGASILQKLLFRSFAIHLKMMRVPAIYSLFPIAPITYSMRSKHLHSHRSRKPSITSAEVEIEKAMESPDSKERSRTQVDCTQKGWATDSARIQDLRIYRFEIRIISSFPTLLCEISWTCGFSGIDCSTLKSLDLRMQKTLPEDLRKPRSSSFFSIS